MGTFVGTWVPRIVLAGATALGGGIGVALNQHQLAEVDPYAEAEAAGTLVVDGDADPPDASANDPFEKVLKAINSSRQHDAGYYDAGPDPFRRIMGGGFGEGAPDSGAPVIVIPTDDEVAKYGLPLDVKGDGEGDLSYEINVFGRQLVGPAVEGAIIFPSLGLEGIGSYRMTYAYRAHEPRDAMFGSSMQRFIFSRKNVVGQMCRRLLPANVRNRPADVVDQIHLHRSGAGFRSTANVMMAAPYVARLATNAVALAVMEDDGTNGLGTAERYVIFTDTAMVTSHVTDYTLFASGLRQIAKGNGSSGTARLQAGHGVNIVSNALSIATGAFRLYAELEREEKTGASVPTAYFYSFMDMAYGGIGILFSLYCLNHLRRTRRRKEKKGKELESYKANNILMGIFDFNPVMRDAMRSISTLGASAALGINGSNLIHIMANPFIEGAGDMMVSSPLGVVGSALALGSAYTLTPGSYPISRLLLAGGSLFIAGQTLYELAPLITRFLN